MERHYTLYTNVKDNVCFFNWIKIYIILLYDLERRRESRDKMIKGIGIDIIELERIERLVKKKPRVLNRLLTQKELAQYTALESSRRRLEYVAGRFAAKEAFAKAKGTGIGKHLSFTDIEILSTSSGAPQVTLKNEGSATYHVSISHSREFAVAQVVIEERTRR